MPVPMREVHTHAHFSLLSDLSRTSPAAVVRGTVEQHLLQREQLGLGELDVSQQKHEKTLILQLSRSTKSLNITARSRRIHLDPLKHRVFLSCMQSCRCVAVTSQHSEVWVCDNLVVKFVVRTLFADD